MPKVQQDRGASLFALPGAACSGGPTKAFTVDLNLNANRCDDRVLPAFGDALKHSQPHNPTLQSFTLSRQTTGETHRPTGGALDQPATQGFGSEDPFVYQRPTVSSMQSCTTAGAPGKHYPKYRDHLHTADMPGRAPERYQTGAFRRGSVALWPIILQCSSQMAATTTFLRRERPHLVLGKDSR